MTSSHASGGYGPPPGTEKRDGAIVRALGGDEP